MFKTLAIILYFFSSLGLAASSARDWAALNDPTPDTVSQSIGSYNSGCLGGAVALPLSGKGYQVMRLSRKRYYGHSSLVQFIQTLGEISADRKLGTLLIGDLGQPRGGPTISGHRSHQTGLDVDIWFLLADRLDGRLLTANERESWGAPSVVDMALDTVDYRQWTDAHEKVLEAAALQPDVDCIFVNPSIKKALCQNRDAASSSWLRKIRPWWKHDDHFHVRLKCPAGNLNCQSQDPLPAGNGCDAGLDWWFSKEAKTPAKPAKPVPPPPLPALCDQILRQ